MRPDKQKLEINFQGGVDTKTDPKQVQAGKYLTLKNSVFDTIGLLKKRNGYSTLPTTVSAANPFSYPAYGANITSGKHITAFGDELLMLDGLNAFAFSEALNSWVYRGRLETNVVTSQFIHSDIYMDTAADSAVNAATGLSLYAWQFSQNDPLNTTDIPLLLGMQYSLIDTNSKQAIINAATFGTAGINTAKPRCIAIGNFLYIFYVDYAATAVKAFSVSASGASGTSTLINDLGTFGIYDVFVNNGLIYVGYGNFANQIGVKSFDSALTPVGSRMLNDTADGGMGIFADPANNIWAGYNTGAGGTPANATRVFIVNGALNATVLDRTTIDSSANSVDTRNVTGIYDGTKGIVFFDKPENPAVAAWLGITTNANYVQPAAFFNVNITVTDATPLTSYVGQKVFIDGGGYYLVVAAGGTTFLAQNLGYSGNAAPGTTVVSPKNIFATGTYSNAQINFNTITVGGVVGTSASYVGSCALNSRAFLKDGFAHVVVCHSSFVQPTYFVTALYNTSASASIVKANISGKIGESISGQIPYQQGLPAVNLLSNNTYEVALMQAAPNSLVTFSNNGVEFSFQPCGVIAANVDFTSTAISSRVLGKNLHIGGGVLEMYDGAAIVEHGFSIFPENVSAVPFGFGSLSAGTYGYQIVYEWVDNEGQTHRSAPSPIISVTVSAGQAVVLTIPTLRVTSKQNVIIAIYRTTANGNIFYRLTGAVSGFGPVYLINDTTVEVVTTIDITGDRSIIGSNEIYTTGEAEDIAAPAAAALQAFKNRMYLIPSEQPYSFIYSKEVLPGSPVEFNPELFIQNIGTSGGPLIGMALMDDKAILFKSESIYYQVGDGPASSGANNDYSEPIFVTSDCGLADVNSIVVMPKGLMFKSKKGIYLLDRGMGASYIGADVEAYNSSTVESAQLIPSKNQVRFLLNSGVILMYDYYVGQWSVFDTINGLSDVIFNDLQYYVDSSGVVHKETPGVYLDGASPVLMSFTTAWMKLSGLQGYQRAYFFYLLGEYLSAHQLAISVYFNYSATASQTTTITPTNSGPNTLENWRVFLAQQRCQAMQFSLQEVYTGTPGAAFTFSGINFILGMKSPFRTIPAAQSAG